VKKTVFIGVWILLGLSVLSFAQPNPAPSCPAFSISESDVIIRLNTPVRFTVKIDTKGRQFDLKYFWNVTSGTIVSGQGTTSIEVVQTEPENQTIALEIKGLPSRCPDTEFLSRVIEYGPEPIKLAQFIGAKFTGDKVELSKIALAMSDNPNNQLYVYFAYKKEPLGKTAESREQDTVDYLTTAIGDRSRITIVRLFRGADVVQFWRIPPGADNPKCDACEPASSEIEMQDCPKISVTTPAGIIDWGQIATFTANIDDRLSQDATYSWTVSKGEIVAGQGTRSLKIRIPETYDMRITATIEVRGIPSGCPNRASEIYEYSIDPGPVELGEIRNTYTIGRKLLAKLGKELRDNPNSQLYVIIYFANEPTGAAASKSNAKLLEQLATTKVDRARFTIVQAPGAVRHVVFFRVPPGADNPTP
jgi:PKD-like domain